MKKYFFKVRLFFNVFCLPLIVFANSKTDNERFLFVYRKHLYPKHWNSWLFNKM